MKFPNFYFTYLEDDLLLHSYVWYVKPEAVASLRNIFTIYYKSGRCIEKLK